MVSVYLHADEASDAPLPEAESTQRHAGVMPKETNDIRDFLKKSRQKDAKYVKVKKGAELTKFKLRLSRYLYTLKVTDQAKADKIAQSFPPGLKKEDIKGKSKASTAGTAAAAAATGSSSA